METLLTLTLSGSALALVLLALGVYRHRSNLERLKNGTENKIGQKAKQ